MAPPTPTLATIRILDGTFPDSTSRRPTIGIIEDTDGTYAADDFESPPIPIATNGVTTN